MKYMYALIALVLTLSLSACGSSENSSNTSSQAEEATMEMAHDNMATEMGEEVAMPEMKDGMQVITIIVRDTGYTPSRILLKAGVPTRLIFDQRGSSECSSMIQIPGLGIKKTTLPPGEKTVIEFVPQEDGECTFTCGMNMLKGAIMVKS